VHEKSKTGTEFLAAAVVVDDPPSLVRSIAFVIAGDRPRAPTEATIDASRLITGSTDDDRRRSPVDYCSRESARAATRWVSADAPKSVDAIV
jgi:hypothetical protein